MTRTKKRQRCRIPPGAPVTCKTPVDAYSSGYAGNPVVRFEPGMVGRLVELGVPSVQYGPEGEDVMALVDFEGPPVGHPPRTTWRCALRYANIRRHRGAP